VTRMHDFFLADRNHGGSLGKDEVDLPKGEG
jgi:hypothetical protein